MTHSRVSSSPPGRIPGNEKEPPLKADYDRSRGLVNLLGELTGSLAVKPRRTRSGACGASGIIRRGLAGPRRPIRLGRARVKGADLRQQLEIALRPSRGSAAPPRVIAALGHAEQATERANRMDGWCAFTNPKSRAESCPSPVRTRLRLFPTCRARS